MKNLFKSYFHYRKSERNGAFVLLFLSFAGLILPQFYNYIHPLNYEVKVNPTRIITEKTQADIPTKEAIPQLVAKETSEVSKSLVNHQQLMEFDPNTADKELLTQLGFSEKLAQTLLNYRSKGGFFKNKEDLQKLYGLSQTFYQQLFPYIKIKATPTSYDTYKRPKFSIDINQADELEWQKLYGIGKAYSKRIVKFRDKLGGFYKTNQVAETYGLPDSTFQKIKPYLVHSPIFRPLYINQVSESELAEHPYVSWKEAKILINYRFHHGSYKSMEDVRASMALGDTILSKIQPYLDFK